MEQERAKSRFTSGRQGDTPRRPQEVGKKTNRHPNIRKGRSPNAKGPPPNGYEEEISFIFPACHVLGRVFCLLDCDHRQEAAGYCEWLN